MAYERELELAKQAAREAGALLARGIKLDKTVLSEIGRDIKLQADQEAEAVILNILGQSDYNVLAEESGEHGDLSGDATFWIVDPLDGTMNFSRGLPLCCVSIALTKGETPVLGVIYDFNQDELYAAVVGEGATMNDVPITVSGITDCGQAVLATGFPVNFVYDEAGLREFAMRIRSFKKARMLGTAALMLAYVACGRVDAYCEDDIMFWDVAAGVALVQAAGGYVDMQPSPTKKWARRVRCAANASIWNQ